jgi:hypothetical protein
MCLKKKRKNFKKNIESNDKIMLMFKLIIQLVNHGLWEIQHVIEHQFVF